MTADDPRRADRVYLDSLIDGSGDLLAKDTFARLEPMFAKYEVDPEMNALLERASVVYGDAAVAVANFVLAEIAAKVAIEKARQREGKS